MITVGSASIGEEGGIIEEKGGILNAEEGAVEATDGVAEAMMMKMQVTIILVEENIKDFQKGCDLVVLVSQ